MYKRQGLRYIWPAGVSETAVEMNKNTDVDVNESVITGLEKPLLFYPEIYYDFKVTGAGTQNASPVSGDMRWVPVYWSQSPEPEENGIFRLWKIGTAKGVYTDKKLTFNLYVFFQKEMYDGTEWKITDTCLLYTSKTGSPSPAGIPVIRHSITPPALS